MNQPGAGIRYAAMIPPAKKITPMHNAIFILWLKAISDATIAPAKVPIACPKNGKIKYSKLRLGHHFGECVHVIGVNALYGINAVTQLDKAHIDDASDNPSGDDSQNIPKNWFHGNLFLGLKSKLTENPLK